MVSSPMITCVVLPSYNESLNIVPLVDAILSLSENTMVCVVDDSSPDGTSEVIRLRQRESPAWSSRVHLITRRVKNGRGGAVREGLRWAFDGSEAFDSFIEMDCDFSHDPAAIPEGLHFLAEGADVALGVRYPGGTILGWPLRRRIFSRVANTLARGLIHPAIHDYTNGFRFYNRRAARLLLSKPQRYVGYIYLSESLSYFLKAGMTIRCFPIRFKNRTRGASNTSLKEIANAFAGIIKIGLAHRFTNS